MITPLPMGRGSRDHGSPKRLLSLDPGRVRTGVAGGRDDVAAPPLEVDPRLLPSRLPPAQLRHATDPFARSFAEVAGRALGPGEGRSHGERGGEIEQGGLSRLVLARPASLVRSQVAGRGTRSPRPCEDVTATPLLRPPPVRERKTPAARSTVTGARAPLRRGDVIGLSAAPLVQDRPAPYCTDLTAFGRWRPPSR